MLVGVAKSEKSETLAAKAALMPRKTVPARCRGTVSKRE